MSRPKRTSRDWIQTYTGRQFFPLDPDEAEIDIIDIAHALSMQCRYTGHVKRFYSVAEHSVRAVGLLPSTSPRILRARTLMHDASEAYLHDLATPIKRQPELAAYREAEEQLEKAIFRRFGLDGMQPELARLVKQADATMLSCEKEVLLGPPPASWGEWPDIPASERPQLRWYGWSPATAERRFLAMAYELGIATVLP